MDFLVRPAGPHEWEAAEALAAEAFSDYAGDHPQWVEALVATRPMHQIAAMGEVLVAAESGGALLGAVGYLPPGSRWRDFFPAEWAILRMLSVPPRNRGRGVARALVQSVIDRAVEDKAPTLGLYTSPVMGTAVGLYKRMGFVHQRALPPERGLPDDLYALELGERAMR